MLNGANIKLGIPSQEIRNFPLAWDSSEINVQHNNDPSVISITNDMKLISLCMRCIVCVTAVTFLIKNTAGEKAVLRCN